MVINSSDKDLAKPSFPQFLIALFLVKSKPIGLLVPGGHLNYKQTLCHMADNPKEYIEALQACVTHGPRQDHAANARCHVDTSALWHEQYKKSEESQIQLRTRISELESLHAAATAEIASKQMKQQKRKRRTKAPEPTLDTDSRKRSRLPALNPVFQSYSSALNLSVNEPGTSLVYEGRYRTRCRRVYELNCIGSNLPEHFYTLQKLASARTPCAYSLAIALSQVSSDIRLILSSIRGSQHPDVVAISNVTTRSQERNFCQAFGKTEQELETRLVAIGCIFPSLLNALSQLKEVGHGALAQPRVIHGIIGLLRDLLERLLSLAAGINKNSLSLEDQTGKKRKLKTSSSVPDDTVMRLCRLTIGLVTSLDSHRATDQEILDGFLYFLLGHVGAMLKLFVFGPDSNEILCPNPERQTLKVSSSSYDEERKTAEAQAPYLVYLLERIAPLAEGYRTCTTRHSTRAPQLSVPSAKPARLFCSASTTLQSTLLAAVFGPQNSAEFVEGLAYPLLDNVDSDAHLVLQPDAAGLETSECMTDWFKAEVWRVLGWEILSGKIAWE